MAFTDEQKRIYRNEINGYLDDFSQVELNDQELVSTIKLLLNQFKNKEESREFNVLIDEVIAERCKSPSTVTMLQALKTPIVNESFSEKLNSIFESEIDKIIQTSIEGGASQADAITNTFTYINEFYFEKIEAFQSLGATTSNIQQWSFDALCELIFNEKSVTQLLQEERISFGQLSQLDDKQKRLLINHVEAAKKIAENLKQEIIAIFNYNFDVLETLFKYPFSVDSFSKYDKAVASLLKLDKDKLELVLTHSYKIEQLIEHYSMTFQGLLALPTKQLQNVLSEPLSKKLESISPMSCG